MSLVEKTRVDKTDMNNSIINENTVLDTNDNGLQPQSISTSITIETTRKKKHTCGTCFRRIEETK